MKKLFVTLLLAGVFGLMAHAQKESGAKLVFMDGSENTTLDYGKIEKDSEPVRVVKFKNNGDEPLIIKNARSTCGCTVPNWPKDPILPGEVSEMTIRYATNRPGKINKKVTITTGDGKDHYIQLDGEVMQAGKEEAVPARTPSIIEKGGK
jgi:hypothetical protein